MANILVWNDDYDMLPAGLEDCPGECRLIDDRLRITEADAVIFHIPTLRDPIDELWKRPGQRWVAWSMESDANYPLLADPGFMSNFELTMTYRRDADVWVPYLDAGLVELLDGTIGGRPHPTLRSLDDTIAPALAVYVASNPAALSERDAYVRELMRHMAVDSYGRCLNNRGWPADHGRVTKLETLSRYPFTLAFENSVTEDYVTEKFFDPFVAGSVPVYLGAPNIGEFAPGEHCFVDVTAFEGPRALAAHLLELAGNETAYREYLAWRTDGVRPEYLGMLDRLTPHPLCRLARLLTEA